ALDEVIRGEDAVKPVPGILGGDALLVVAGPEPALDLASHALQRGGGDDALGRAPDAEEDVDAGVRPGRGDGAVDVAVGDEADARTCFADLADQVEVALPVEDDH